MSVADALQRSWYAPHARVPWWARPLAWLYGRVTGMRRALYRRGLLASTRLSVPVIVIGNITVGGVGKTPLVIALVESLRARGFKPGVVSRGYGGSARAPMLLDAQPDPTVSGDEPALIRWRTSVPVAVGADRPAAARLLVAAGVDVIVADDGLQHYALARDLEICVVDGVRRFGNGRLLPAGPLREPESRLRDVDFIVCNGGEAHTGEVPMQLALHDAVALRDASKRKPVSAFSGTPVHAMAGIGNPQRFFNALRGCGVDVVEHPFPDHHRYTASDLAFAGNQPVLMTEKDAVKCRGFALGDGWSVPVDAGLPETFFDGVVAKLANVRR